jgi:hypothetical protein
MNDSGPMFSMIDARRVRGPFASSSFMVWNPAQTFYYTIVGSAITANRNLTLPNISTNDTIAVLALIQTFTGRKTFSGGVTLNSAVLISKRTDTADANYLVLSTDFIIACNHSAPRTVTLPVAANGMIYIIKDEAGTAAAQNITIQPDATLPDLIDGAANKVINTAYGSLTFYGITAVGWFTI